MIKVESWPVPDWEEVRISWQRVFDEDEVHPYAIEKWLEEQPGGRWHLHGYNHNADDMRYEGFAYRFENPHDATIFRLRWL